MENAIFLESIYLYEHATTANKLNNAAISQVKAKQTAK